MSKTIVLIPARMASTRLPGKPLADIHGEPMIVHVWRRGMEAQIGEVVVATDSEAVATAVEKAGGRAVMTRGDHPSVKPKEAFQFTPFEEEPRLPRGRVTWVENHRNQSLN